jgi:maltooligosyltrehalose synthase
LFAFARSNEQGVAVTCVPRLIAGLVGDSGRPPLGREIWDDTTVQLPAGFADIELCDAFSGRRVTPCRTANSVTVAAADLFADYPVALLLGRRATTHP